ncbi:MAG: helix-turn-helix domain-containing protein [Geothrix sp.]|uniref:helix-turn-helix transcriptional regulator n=1 Tax=Geothrix sp. TaxID=1962974 RepID=UPI003BB126B0
MTPNDLITAKETAQRLHIAVGTLKRWRRGHAGPPWCRVGSRAVRYPVALLEAWVNSKNAGTGLDTGTSSEGRRRTDDLTGIIPTSTAVQGPQPQSWNFITNIRPQGG